MSVTSQNDIYQKMVVDDINETMDPLQKAGDYIYINCDATDKKSKDGGQGIINKSNIIKTDDCEQFEEVDNEILEDCSDNVISNNEEWNDQFEEEQHEIKFEAIKAELYDEEEEVVENSIDSLKDCVKDNKTVQSEETSMVEQIPQEGAVEEEDEETIATFITAAGQQLALYAVENSDEIFAVALYDESGDPPSNFQFLMKSDVEKLIGEGAVRTVKKPSQLKRQLLTTQTPVVMKEKPSKPRYDPKSKVKYNVYKSHKTIWEEPTNKSEQNVQKVMKPSSNIIYTTVRRPLNVNYIVIDNTKTSTYTTVQEEQKSEKKQVKEDSENETELMEQSTVECLFEDDQSDSELTFDEIKATLQKLRSNKMKSTPKKDAIKNPANGLMSSNAQSKINSKPNIIPPIYRRAVKKPEILSKNTVGQHFLHDSSSNIVLNDTEDIAQECFVSPVASPEKLKAKRPRKQKLEEVNRGDPEIIIQAASLVSEEEEVPVKKRGRRKRKVLPDPDYNPRTPVRKLRKMRKRSRVEVIEIDVDEEQRQGDIEEITIDDGKEKSSSDKENNVIMVGDSDDDSQASDEKLSSPMLTCQFCSRNFRQRRVLDTHTRICAKSPANAHRLVKRTPKSNPDPSIKREFTCKTCEEKFDAALTLARHVRSNHPQHKRGRPRKTAPTLPVNQEVRKTNSPAKVDDVEKIVEQKDKEEKKDEDLETKKETKLPVTAKRKKHNNHFIMEKSHKCDLCARIFFSVRTLIVHTRLRHVTRKSEKYTRYCKVCKKVLRSKKQFTRHMKMHKEVTKVARPVKIEPEKTEVITRQPDNPTTVVRKRGRPRKNKVAA